MAMEDFFGNDFWMIPNSFDVRVVAHRDHEQIIFSSDKF